MLGRDGRVFEPRVGESIQFVVHIIVSAAVWERELLASAGCDLRGAPTS